MDEFAIYFEQASEALLEALARRLTALVLEQLSQQLAAQSSPWLDFEAACAYCPDGKVALEQVEEFIRQLARDYQLRELAFDPHFFNRSAELLEDAGIKTIEFLQASGPMADAYQGFYQLALEGKLAHDGDPVFAAHIEATAASKSERGWKLRKLHNKKRIDATVAAALAVARIRHKPKRKANTFWMDV